MRNWLGVEHEPDGHLEGVPQPDPHRGLMITMVFLTTQMSPGMILQLSVAEGGLSNPDPLLLQGIKKRERSVTQHGYGVGELKLKCWNRWFGSKGGVNILGGSW